MQDMITNPERAKQIVDYRGLMFGTGYPTDIDGMIEWRNKCYILFELKYGSTEPKPGQRLALERIADDLSIVKPTLLILAEHNAPVGEVIYAAEAIVRSYRYNGRWKDRWTGRTVKEIIEDFLKFVEEE